MENIGERLKKARLKKRLTLEQVHKDTKIHPKILTALEDGSAPKQIGHTYVRSFLKIYSNYLGLNIDEILSEFDNLYKKEESLPALKVSGVYEKTGLRLKIPLPRVNLRALIKKVIDISKRWLLRGVIGSMGVAIGVAVIFLGIRVTKDFSAKIRANIKKLKQLEATARPIREVKEETYLVPLYETLSLQVVAKGDVWLQIKSDGDIVFEQVLEKGSIEIWKAEKEFRIWTGNGSLIDLVLNGNPLGSPGRGVIKNIVVTHKGLKVE